MVINSTDYTGVIRALKDLQSDINKVTSHTPVIVYDKLPQNEKQVVIVGTYGKSPLIDQLVRVCFGIITY